VLLIIVGVLSALGVFAFINRVGVESDILDGNFTSDLNDRIDDADGFVGGTVAFYLLLMIAILVLIIIWTFRAMKNNEALGRQGARFTPGWGIAGWLIPLANLVIPVLIFQDLWRGSDPGKPVGDPSWRGAQGSGLVGVWWAAHVIGHARFGTLGGEADVNDRNEVEDLRTSDTVAAVGMAVSIAGAVLAILVLRRIAERQENLRRGVTAA